MITKQQRTLLQRVGKFACYLLVLVLGTFATSQQDAVGQTVPDKGRIIVRKVTQPNPDPSNTSFGFSIGGGLSPANFTLRNGQSRSFSSVTPGTYAITEKSTLLWELSSATCSDGSPVNNIQVAPGETITCIFTNRSTLVDLSLSKEANRSSVSPGQRLVYTLTYANNSLLPFDVVLTEQLPAHTTFVGPSGWNCIANSTGGTTCQLQVGLVAPKASGEVEFQVQVNNSVPAGVTQISNRATIGTSLLAELDEATLSTKLELPPTATPDLALTKSDGGGATAPGNTVVYELTYQNLGGQAATGVVLRETLPDHTTFEPNQSSNGWLCNGGTCQLVVGTVAGGATVTVRFAVKVVTPLPPGITTITNNATITGDGNNGADPTPGNNSATVITAVNPTIAVVAAKRDALVVDADQDGVPSPGDTIEYTVQIRNNGNIGVRTLRFSDTPDANSTLLPGVESSQGSVTLGNNNGDSRIEVALGNLAGGASATIRFRVQVRASLPLDVIAIQNQGVLSSDDFTALPTDDPDTDATADATRTALRSFAQLQATLIDYLFIDGDGNEVVSLGDTLLYRLTLDNVGNGPAGGVQIVDVPTLGLVLVNGSVVTSLGSVTEGNVAGESTVRVEIPLLSPGGRVVVSYQMVVGEGVADVIQNQATITAQSGTPSGTSDIVTDDPDIEGNADVTLTPLGSSPPTLKQLFLPLVAK